MKRGLWQVCHLSLLLRASIVIAGLFVAQAGSADDLRPLYIELQSLDPTSYAVRVRLPPGLPAHNSPLITMPSHCQATATAIAAARYYKCTSSLAGERIEFRYPLADVANTTIVRVLWADGASHTQVLPLGVRSWIQPHAETVASVMRQYTRLGFTHIWLGWDHLLFVLCLIWIAGDWRRIVITITGFTLAHSITLSLAALGWVNLAVPPVEAVIALSVLFLAVELRKGPRPNLTWRYPVAVAAAFGLLHGLGFAAVLGEIGLPQNEVVAGLVFFNVGVELGQITFAALVIALLRLVSAPAWQTRARIATSYAVGCVAAFWFVERVAGFI